MSTALILRPNDAPEIHVLECDGPRQKHVQRDEGFYRLATDNQPLIGSLISHEAPAHDPRLKDWPDATWEIVQHHDGRIEVLANRPTEEEIYDGDLHGDLGSTIKISWPCRLVLRNALRIARLLCKADTVKGIQLSERDLIGITVIETNIPCILDRKAA
jgi:hypothetical protein